MSLVMFCLLFSSVDYVPGKDDSLSISLIVLVSLGGFPSLRDHSQGPSSPFPTPSLSGPKLPSLLFSGPPKQTSEYVPPS